MKVSVPTDSKKTRKQELIDKLVKENASTVGSGWCGHISEIWPKPRT